jgi:hypothetical protein
VGTHVLNITHELNSSKNVGTHVLNFTHEHLSVSCSADCPVLRLDPPANRPLSGKTQRVVAIIHRTVR